MGKTVWLWLQKGRRASTKPKGQFQEQGAHSQAVSQIQRLSVRPKRLEETPGFDLKSNGDAADTNKAEGAEQILEAAEDSKSQETHDEVPDVLLPKGVAKQASNPEQADSSHVANETERPRSLSSEDISYLPSASRLPSVVSVWLDSIQQDQDYSTIARACEELCGQELEDGDGHQSPRKPVVPGSAHNTGKSSSTGGKRKSSALDGSQGQRSSAKPKLSTQSSYSFNENLSFTCHFSKKNRIRYEPCCSKMFHNISHLAEHLRRNHKLTCADCWAKFENAELLAAHISGTTCQDTGGTPVHELRVPKTKNGGLYKRWYTIWEMLCPELNPPESPYWQRYEPNVMEVVDIIAMHLPGRLRGIMPDDHIELVMNTFRNLQLDIHNATAEPSNTQLATPSLSSGSIVGGANLAHTLSESEISEGQSSFCTATSPYLHPETTPEEQRSDVANSTTSTAEVEHETDYQVVTNDVRTTQTIITAQRGPEWIGLNPENANYDQISLGNHNPEFNVNLDFDVEDDFDFTTLESAEPCYMGPILKMPGGQQQRGDHLE
ncbi:uncharacterized protein PG998_004002 [Apiospora kogelbergensis]|uniref:uncharacterized protein n=1 Tax=Apiospora kogelbergensis TaxID=1337665 RepID=UPI003131FBF2